MRAANSTVPQRGDKTLTANSGNSLLAFRAMQDSQITPSISCVPVTVCFSGDVGRSDKANAEPDRMGLSALDLSMGTLCSQIFVVHLQINNSQLFPHLMHWSQLFTSCLYLMGWNQRRKTPKELEHLWCYSCVCLYDHHYLNSVIVRWINTYR